jgi:uncharacterized protein (DUF1697 family)
MKSSICYLALLRGINVGENNLIQSYLSKIITLPIYKFMTIRNWNTTSKLLTLMEK